MATKVSKEKSEKNVEFAKGGNTPMFGKGDRTTTAPQEQAGEQKPGGTAHNPSGGGGQYAEGGKGKMFGFSPSVPAKAGITSAR